MRRWAGSTARRVLLIATVGLPLLGLAQVVLGGNIDPDEKWAWATNAGWINFSPVCDGCEGATVYADHLEGYALSLIHISEPTRLKTRSRMPSSA